MFLGKRYLTKGKNTVQPTTDTQSTDVKPSLTSARHDDDYPSWNKTHTILYGCPEYELHHDHHYISLQEKDETTAFKTHTIQF